MCSKQVCHLLMQCVDKLISDHLSWRRVGKRLVISNIVLHFQPLSCVKVVVSEATLVAVDAARAVGRPLWRVSSTTFVHLASDGILQPLGVFATDKARISLNTILARLSYAVEARRSLVLNF